MLTEPFATAPTEFDQKTDAGEEWLCFPSSHPGELFGALLPQCCACTGEKRVECKAKQGETKPRAGSGGTISSPACVQHKARI